MKRRDRGLATFAARASRRLPEGSAFLRGLSIGALVGAAIAGSAIWERLVRRQPAGAPGEGRIDAGHGAPGTGDGA